MIAPEQIRLTKHFTLAEFLVTIHGGGTASLVREFQRLNKYQQSMVINNCTIMATLLQELIRDKYGKPVIIHSGLRTPRINRLAGGANGSAHLWSAAVDFHVEGVDLVEVYRYLDKGLNWPGGLAIGPGFIHVDVRLERARWKY